MAHLRTVPVVRAADLDARADRSGGARVWLALEAMQVTGSFKVRGALLSLEARKREGAQAVVAASAGNHGAGVAYAAGILGLRAAVVMPRSVPAAKRSRVEAYGAKTVLAPSDHYDDAEDLAREIAAKQGVPFVSPYDDEVVVAGNGASLGFEIFRALGRVPDVTLAPFGGGGLSTGLAWAYAIEGGPGADRSVWGVQSEASPAMAMSLERGAAVERFASDVPTLAEGLEGGVSRGAFERARAAIAGVLVVSERGIASAMIHAHRGLGLVLEGSAAAGLVPVLEGLPRELCRSSPNDVVVVLTGRNVDPERLGALISGNLRSDPESQAVE